MEAQHFTQHFGVNYQAQLKTKPRMDFKDKQKVVDLLRSLNLLKKTLVPTQTTVEALLQDPSIPEGQKAQISALGQKVEMTDLELKKTE